jgi:hypothetical protein
MAAGSPGTMCIRENVNTATIRSTGSIAKTRWAIYSFKDCSGSMPVSGLLYVLLTTKVTRATSTETPNAPNEPIVATVSVFR